MNLKNAIIWVIAGTGYTLLLKLAHVLIPGAFENDHIFFLSKFLMLLVFMGQLFFLGYFYRDYAQPTQKQLRLATRLCFILPFFNLIFHLKSFVLQVPDLRVRTYEISSGLFGLLNRGSSGFTHFLALFGSLALVYFFWILYRELKPSPQKYLTFSALLMLFATSANLLKSLVILLTGLLHDHPGVFLTVLEKFAILAVPLFLFMTFSTIYFYITFYRTLE